MNMLQQVCMKRFQPLIQGAPGIARVSGRLDAMGQRQQLLQGLTTGNQRDDQALRDAFERGYERGRQDEARAQRDRDDRLSRRDRDRFDPRYPRDDRR